MAIFETALVLIIVAIVMLQVSRRLPIPYPTVLAIAGVVVGALPWTPTIHLDPDLALALFIAPALLDAAFDLPPRALRRSWVPLLSLAAVLVVVTTAAVAFLGVTWVGMPLAAAIALGAIVAPPDAAAAVAVLGRFALPRVTVQVLMGESLLNDASALLVFNFAVRAAAGGETALAWIALAVPGGLLVGLAAGYIYVFVQPKLAGSLGGVIFQFAATFGTWVLATRLHLSAILAVVVYGMVIARYVPARTTPRMRVSSYAVWESAVFLLNVLAFLLMGLQARDILGKLDASELSHALTFAAAVFGTVIVVRVVWVLAYNRFAKRVFPDRHPTIQQSTLVAWCGMRGVVTLATALALPQGFPHRDLIVLSALAVVLGTLVVQGLTLGPLIRFLKFPEDRSFGSEISATRILLLDVAEAALEGKGAETLLAEYRELREASAAGAQPREVARTDQARRHAIGAKRKKLAELRREGKIEDDVFHTIEQELDWAELASSPPDRFEMVES